MAAGIGIIIIAIGVLVLVGFGVGLTLWITGGGGNKSGEMACGGCGYLVRGLEQLNCPECGADLRSVGIGTGASGGRKLTGILLTVICGIILLSCSGLIGLGMFASGRSSRQMHQTTPLQNQPAPPSGTQGASDSDAGDDEGEGQDTPPEPGSQ